MKVTIDKRGRLVIPRPLRERTGLADGGTVEIDLEGSGLRIRPVAGIQRREEGDVLVIPRTGGHAWFETDSVLTRLPGDLRRSPADAERLLAHNFPAASS